MAASKSCTVCSQTSSAVWRLDRETKDVLCNACYLKKYPRSSENGSDANGANKRRKKGENGAPLQDRGDRDERFAQEPVKEEQSDIKQESIREDGIDIKQEIKNEVKDEVKKEDNSQADNSLGDIFAAVEEPKAHKKSRKTMHNAAASQVNGPPPEFTFTSDTEYEEADPAAAPSSIIIEASGLSKIDGRYDQMPKSLRGRKCYYMWKKEKHMYLYWHKDLWKVGLELGINKNYARLTGVKQIKDCCEPYPHAWQVYQAEEKKYNPAPAMRVYDLKAAGEQPQLPEPLMEAVSASAKLSSTGTPADAVSAERKKSEKKEKKEKKAEVKAEVKKENSEVKKEEEAPSSDSDSSSSSSKSAQSSSSDSDEDDKKAEASPNKGQGTAESAELAQAKALVKQAHQREEQQKKSMAFQNKLRGEVSKIQDPQARNKKLETIKQMLSARREQLLQAAGLTGPDIDDLVVSLERDFGTKEVVKVKTEENVKAEPGAMPSTPPENVADPRDPSHRTAATFRGVLKSRERRGTANRHERISTKMQMPDVTHVPIASYRTAGETLWYTSPGSLVICDACERSVPQTMGALQGAPGRSQFAQDQFACVDCMGGMQTG